MNHPPRIPTRLVPHLAALLGIALMAALALPAPAVIAQGRCPTATPTDTPTATATNTATATSTATSTATATVTETSTATATTTSTATATSTATSTATATSTTTLITVIVTETRTPRTPTATDWTPVTASAQPPEGMPVTGGTGTPWWFVAGCALAVIGLLRLVFGGDE